MLSASVCWWYWYLVGILSVSVSHQFRYMIGMKSITVVFVRKIGAVILLFSENGFLDGNQLQQKSSKGLQI